MNSTMNLYRMQSRQREHDVRHHTDIHGGDPKQRMTHYEFHYAKYVGKIAELTRQPDEKALSAGLDKIVTDAFIITLAASDALNIDFKAAPAQTAAQPLPSKKAAAEELLYDLAIYQGGIAKALDSYDHLESFAIGDEMRRCTQEIMRVLLTAADRIGLHLEPATFSRWKEIEAKRIL